MLSTTNWPRNTNSCRRTRGPEYGTGAVKVTPARPNDFEIGLRHDLPRLQVIDYDSRMINVPKRV